MTQRTESLARYIAKHRRETDGGLERLDRTIALRAVELLNSSDDLPNISRRERDAFHEEMESIGFVSDQRRLPDGDWRSGRRNYDALAHDAWELRQTRRARVDSGGASDAANAPVQLNENAGPLSRQQRKADQRGGTSPENIGGDASAPPTKSDKSASVPLRSRDESAHGSAELEVLRSLGSTLLRIETALETIAANVEAIEGENRRAKMGDNVPPDMSDGMSVDRKLLTETAAAITLVQQEIAREQPGEKALLLSGLVLERSASRFKVYAEWLGAKSDKFLDALLESAGSATGKVIVGSAALKMLLDQLNIDLQHVAAVISSALKFLH